MANRWYINRKEQFPADGKETITNSMDFIEESLNMLGTDRKLVMKVLLTAEEVLAQLIEHAAPGGMIQVRVRKFFGEAWVRIRAAGSEYNPYTDLPEQSGDLGEMEDEDAQRAIRSILLKSEGEKLKFSYKNGVNLVRILTGQAESSMLRSTIAALILGLVFGALMRGAIPAQAADAIQSVILEPVRTMFMNALKIIIAPVVFFSIVSCVTQFKDLTELGRIGAKVMGLYLMTTVMAVLLAMGISRLLNPGKWGFALSAAADPGTVSVNTDVDTSILHTIVNIVPSNFVSPFLEANTMQLIFLAVLCGIAVGMIGEYSSVLKDFFEACNSLFLTITAMITRFIPAAVFCSVSLMFRAMGGSSFLPVLEMAGTVIFAIFCMMAVYGILILVTARLNPLTFFKKNKEGMLTSFTLCSSAAAIPVNMKTCTDKLGISPKVCSFSIPLGATVNMDGCCIMLVVSCLFLAKAYGISIPGSAMVSLAVTIILLSLGSPGVPGAGLVCIGIVPASAGVPIEALGLIIGIYPVLDMFITMSNTTGDVAAALIAARSEELLDLEKYRA